MFSLISFPVPSQQRNDVAFFVFRFGIVGHGCGLPQGCRQEISYWKGRWLMAFVGCDGAREVDGRATEVSDAVARY